MLCRPYHFVAGGYLDQLFYYLIERHVSLNNLNLDQYKAIIISDYDKGYLTEKDIESSLTMKNKLNQMIVKGWKILPKWVKGNCR